MKDQKGQQNEQSNEWMRKGLIMFVQTTGWIAFPVVGALFLGRWLDNKYGTEPWLFLGVTVLAFIISSIGIGSIGLKYMKEIDAEYRAKKTNQDDAKEEKR